MDRTEHRFFPSGRLPGGDFRVRRQSCQQDGAEQQRERAAPPGHVCASAHGGVSGAQSRFAGADCPAGQLCRPADRRARCPADRRAPCRADFRVESVHVSPPFRCGSVCAAALFHAGGGIALRGRAFCIPGLNPGGTGFSCRKRVPAGGLLGWLPADLAVPESVGGACLLCRLLPLPLACFLVPIPPTPFPAGRGRLKVILCKGLCPLHPQH